MEYAPILVHRISPAGGQAEQSHEARTGLLTVCAQVLQAQDRIDFYSGLASPVREHLAPPVVGQTVFA
ncbi:hypothetical protein [Streptomyces goshikiensis]|uniref:hypothetical protein n=1 Tax=Streptomyces goshikiensis TaxID=1942 RepID=UPI0036C6EE2D